MSLVSTVVRFPTLTHISAAAFVMLLWAALEGWRRAGTEWKDLSWLYAGSTPITHFRVIVGMASVLGLLDHARWTGKIPWGSPSALIEPVRTFAYIGVVLGAALVSIAFQLFATVAGFSIRRSYPKESK